MGISERKERERLEMRQRILEVATKLFLEEGYDKTSIRNIAESIEYSPATIYLYFNDKDEIFLEIHNQGFSLLFDEFRKSEIITDPILRLQAISNSYLDFALKNPEYYDLMFIMRGPVNKILEQKKDWESGGECFEYFLNIVSNAIEQGSLRKMDKYIAAMTMWSALHGMICLYVRDRFKIMELDNDVLATLIHASSENLLHQFKN